MRCRARVLVGLALGCGALLSDCGSALYVPTPADATAAASLEELTRGRELYAGKCSGCHRLHLPSEFDEAVWQKKLDEMQPRARLSDTEKTLIRKYLAGGGPKQIR